MTTKIVCLSAIFATSLAINAAAVNNVGEIESGVEYTYAAKEAFMGTFTAPSDGMVRVSCTGDVIHPYTDENHTVISEGIDNFYGEKGSKVYLYNIGAGETLWFYEALPLDGGVFTLEYGKDNKLDIRPWSISPAQSDTDFISFIDHNSLELTFTVPVNITKCTLQAADETVETSAVINGPYVTVNWGTQVLSWYRNGKLDKGDILTVTLTGIRNAYNSGNRPNYGDGAGKLVLKYKVASKPAELKSQKNTPLSGNPYFNSFYFPGAEEGMVSLTFERDLDPNHRPEAVIQYGDLDRIDLGMYVEYPPVKVEGNTVTVDLTGKLRMSQQMVPGLAKQQYIAMRITNVMDIEGQYVWTGQVSSPRTFSFSYLYNELAYKYAADWYPVRGAVLESGKQMELWIMNGRKLSFETVDFAYTSDGQPAKTSVPFSEVRVEEDPYSADDLSFFFSVPELNADADTEIFVTLGNPMFADGLDHSGDILGKFKAATSGVAGIEAVADADVLYDLQGRAVKNPSAGIYIRNGKKVVVK